MMYVYIVNRSAARSWARAMRAGTGGPEHRAMNGTALPAATVAAAPALVGVLACDHLATLELGRADDLWQKPPHREDPELKLLQERGEAHERAFLERRCAEGLSIVEF